jgi:predicted dehydrogenase
MKKAESRRSFLSKIAASSYVAAVVPSTLSITATRTLRRQKSRARYSPNDQIQLALIGAGGMGTIDVNTAISIEGVKLLAACDLYDGRLTKAQEEWGEEDPIITTRDYREILARDDVDAVIVAVPDHWHKKISIDAMRAGKAVYVEKPMVHNLDDGPELIRVQNETGQTLEVGSQGMSSLGNEKAKELYEQGVIGELNFAEGFWARNSPNGAWQYEIPEDASPETVDWDTFLGDAPRYPFDPIRFFRWRNYYDYGTGVSGDLFVHLFSSLHSIVGSNGPNKIQATGGLRFWRDGRDAPDVVLGMFDYPQTENHPPFNLSLRCNFVDGTSGSTFLRLVGSEGSMDITWTEVTVRLNKKNDPNQDPFAQAKEDEQKARFGERKQMLPPSESVYKAEEGYWGAHVDHFNNFFAGVRDGTSVIEDSVFGFRAAAPALICNDCLAQETIVRWDPDNMRLAS